MLQIQSFLTSIIGIITGSLTWIGTNDSIMIAPFIFWLLFNVVALFRLILLASYRKGFY